MSVSVNIPEISALRRRVEAVYGQPLQTHNAFIALVDTIDAALREHLSESTLERLWGYSTRGADAVSLRTLDVLSRYVGAASWADFKSRLKAETPRESEEFAAEGIASSSLAPGAEILLGWLPDRRITVKYLGDNRFEVTSSENSSLQPGDSFSCLQFQKGHPLYLDRFRRAGSTHEARYVAGERNGLTLLQQQ